MNRRDFFSLFRPESATPHAKAPNVPDQARGDFSEPGAFSICAFYKGRAAVIAEDPSSTRLPEGEGVFRRRDELAPISTTSRGRGPAASTKPSFVPPSGLMLRAAPRVRPESCLAYLGSPCTVCSEQCPAPGAILQPMGRPTIDTSKCTGCGVCISVCPALINGFELDPGEEGEA